MILMLLAPHVAILLRAALNTMSRSESRWYCAQNCSRPISESSVGESEGAWKAESDE
jgi:hypothetical protein